VKKLLQAIALILLYSNASFAVSASPQKAENAKLVIQVLIAFGLMSLVSGISIIKKKKFESDGLINVGTSFWGSVYCILGAAMLLLGLAISLSI